MIGRIVCITKLWWQITLLCLHDTLAWLLPLKRKIITEDVILITGGGRGIGRSIALTFAKYNPKHIILWGRTESTLNETAQNVREHGVNCAYMICDVSIREQVYCMAKEVEARFGPVSLLVNNAGIVQPNSILDCSAEALVGTLSTNTLAHFWTVKSFLPGMLKQNRGHLVFVNSMLGVSGLNGASDYCSSKYASSGFVESLRDELSDEGKKNIHITSIYPFHVDNSMFAGVSTRFPKIFPSLKEDYLAEKIVDGVLTNRCTIMAPKLMYAVTWFYSVAPARVVTAIMRFVEADKAIAQYKEHQKKSTGVR